MKKAFTLIELLVVVTIIAILAAVALPVFAKATKRARRTECASNLRQIGSAISAYASDWDEKYPWAYGNTAVSLSPASRPALSQILQPYVRSEAIFRCPSDIGETFPKDVLTYHRRTPPFYAMSLSSYLWDGIRFGGCVIAGRETFAVKRPAEAVLSGELRPWHGEYGASDKYFESSALYNVLYCDGHVAGKTATEWQAEADARFQ